MNVYDISGNQLIPFKNLKLVGAILDAPNETNRFLAMKQLFDIAKKKLKNSEYSPSATEFTYATKGAVCLLPDKPAMYEQYPIEILWSQSGNVQSIPASTTKVMNLVTALPFIDDIKEKVTLVSGDIESGSGNYFSAGDILTIEDLIFGMMLPSSNTCAKTLAHFVGAKIIGNSSASVSDCVTAFIAEMNKKATLLGCTGSSFDTPSGLSTTNKSTVADMLRFTIEACSFPEILRVWNKKSYNIAIGGANARTQAITTTVTNATLEDAYYIFGGKTGHLNNNAANALVMVAEPNDLNA